MRDELPAYRLFEVVVDSADPERWPAGGRTGSGSRPTATAPSWWWIDKVPGMPFEKLVFVPVPEPKTVKNRIHWDVTRRRRRLLEPPAPRVLRETPSW